MAKKWVVELKEETADDIRSCYPECQWDEFDFEGEQELEISLCLGKPSKSWGWGNMDKIIISEDCEYSDKDELMRRATVMCAALNERG